LQAEVAAYIAAHAGELDEQGRRLVVRNGHAEPREALVESARARFERGKLVERPPSHISTTVEAA
jgi:hypothetical protein